MAAQNIGHRTGALEILLHQAQTFTGQMVIVGIQDFGQLFRLNALFFCLKKFTVVKPAQVKRLHCTRFPQAQRLGDAILITYHRQIPGFPAQGEFRHPVLASVVLFQQHAAKADIHRQRAVVAEPRIAFAVPVIRRFLLLAVAERLAEQTVLVVQSVAGSRLANGGHRIEETGRQPA